MRKAQLIDQPLISNILTKAFKENKSVNYVVKQDKYCEKRRMKLMEYSFKVCQTFGEVWISDNNHACALLLFPNEKKTTLQSVIWDIQLIFSVIGINRVNTILKKESAVKKNYPKDSFCYLWFIGVDPDQQHKGSGSILLQEIIQMYDNKHKPIYLETSVENNLVWYEKFGFQIFNTIDLTYRIYQLRKMLI